MHQFRQWRITLDNKPATTREKKKDQRLDIAWNGMGIVLIWNFCFFFLSGLRFEAMCAHAIIGNKWLNQHVNVFLNYENVLALHKI